MVIASVVSFPAAWFAGPGGRPDRLALATMVLLLIAARGGLQVSRRAGARGREAVGVALIGSTSLWLVLVASRSQLPTESWLGAIAAAAVAMATIRDARARLGAQALTIAALGGLLGRDHEAPLDAQGAVEVFGPLLLVVVIAWLAGALADDLALARQRELDTRRAAERRAELLAAVRELSTAGPGQAVDITVEALQDLGFPVAAVLLVGADGLRARRVEGVEPRDDYGQGVSGYALSTGRTVVSGDYRNDDLRLPGLDLGAVVATPIRADGRTLGVVTVALDEAGAPPMGDVEVVEVLAAHLGGALANDQVVRNQDALLTRLRDLDGLRASFVDRVSEDLRDPLTVVRGVAQTLAAYGDRLPDGQREVLLERLTVQAEDLGETLEALLDFSRVHVGRSDPRPEPIDVLALLAPALAGTGMDVRVSGRPVVIVDRDLVRRAFGLLRRASLDIEGGLHLRRVDGTLTVDVRLRQLEGLQGGFARALAEQLFVAAGAGSERLPDGLRLRMPLADPGVAT
ncbi:sensor histidine kinase [Nitriliruptor alkaliphilus]|uniref:sensor histidine kinase n=1 Tax=Nitriliruptor alkaliphilus TaxID=427918 RepID=UPI000AA43590|nr:GAF domain-containing protein [Nitriliruptor alkaliphilus]